MSYLSVRRKAIGRVSVPNFLSGLNCAYDQSVLNPSVAAGCYNFDFTSGALESCAGFVGTGIKAESVWIYRSNDLNKEYLMFYRDGKVFYRDGEDVELKGVRLTSPPKAINYRLYGEDVVLICSPTDNMVVWNGADDPYYVGSSPLITSMTMHYERMFVTTSNARNTLWFSDDLDPTNWNSDMTEGGFIELADERGALIKVLGFLNYVYIFRERGISRLTAYADQAEFSVSHLYVTGGRIFPESVALCGDKVIFASTDGLFVFDGVSARRILQNLDGLFVPDENSAAAYHGGKYYLALKANFEDGADNAILVYGDDGYTIMRGYDVRGFYSGGDVLYAIVGDSICTLGGKSTLGKKWTVPFTDLGSGRRKRIKDMYIDTRTDIELTVRMDSETKRFHIRGKQTTSRIFINMTGRKFGFDISCDSPDAHISRPQLTYCFADT